jgi:CRISPR-associated protein (Cas_APE2256)
MTLWIATCGLSITSDPKNGLAKTGTTTVESGEISSDFDLDNGSAELSGLKRCVQNDSVVLYASDTDEGARAASAVQVCLKRRIPGLLIDVVRVGGLNPAYGMASFENALVDLGKDAAKRTLNLSGDVQVVLSGGFKSAIPYVYILLSAVATFRRKQHWGFVVEFENGSEPIEIPVAVMSELVKEAAVWAVNKPDFDVNKVAERTTTNREANLLAARSVVRCVNGQWELSPLGHLVVTLKHQNDHAP